MKYLLYCLYDKAAEFYSNVNQTNLSEEDLISAIRRDIKKDIDNKIYAQKKLIHLGYYDDDTGEIITVRDTLLDLDEEIKKLKEVKSDVNSPHV